MVRKRKVLNWGGISIKEKGFSLVELLTVIGVIGILASIVLPKFASMRGKSFDTNALSDLKQIELYQKQFKGEHYIYAPFNVGDKTGSTLSVSVGGNSFTISSLSPDVELISKTSADGQTAIIAAKHTSSQTIVAMDLDAPGIVYKLENQAALTGAVIPASTSGNDLSGWAKF